MRLNALHNCTNPYQGDAKKVLAVCSAGLLRSPTIAWVLSNDPWNYNTRAVGTEDYALIQIDPVHLHWADEIVTVSEYQCKIIEQLLTEQKLEKDLINLNIPDKFGTRDPELVALIKKGYEDVSIFRKGTENVSH